MNILLLGVGMQGKAALHDLANNPGIDQIVAADQDLRGLTDYVAGRKYGSSVACLAINAEDPGALDKLFGQGFFVAIDLLPSRLSPLVAQAAVKNRVHLVNTVYAVPEIRELAAEAKNRDLTILPEFGMDPGIDLVFLGEAVRQFDQIEEIHGYGAGIPEEACANNPLHYKVTWTFDGVLRSYMRPARMIRYGTVVDIPDNRQFYPEFIHNVDFFGLGILEAYPNGDVLDYLKILGLNPQMLRQAGRYSMRWPGHCAFWKTMVDLHLLDDQEIMVGGKPVNKRKFLAAALEPHIRLGDGERDLSIIRVDVKGLSAGKNKRKVYEIVDRRDLQTGLTAMNRLVGFTASIGAQMIISGQLSKRGLLSPVVDVPYETFCLELGKRGIDVTVR